MVSDLPDSAKLEIMMYIAIEQARDLEIADARVEKYQRMYDTEKRPWYEAAWHSDITKVVIFIGGVWLGREMVVVR